MNLNPCVECGRPAYTVHKGDLWGVSHTVPDGEYCDGAVIALNDWQRTEAAAGAAWNERNPATPPKAGQGELL